MDEVSAIIKESLETVIGGNAYSGSKVNEWTAQVVETVLSSLSKLDKAFKYIGECSLLPNMSNSISQGIISQNTLVSFMVLLSSHCPVVL